MDDFDRGEKAKPENPAKKTGIAIGLGVVLIGVLGYHFLSGGPKPVAAAEPNPLASLESMTGGPQTPEQALLALRNDPTDSLLRGSTTSDHSLDVAPRNAFIMAESWRATLVRPAPAVVVVQTIPKPQAPQPQAQALRADDFHLGSIFRQGDHYSAVVNGRIVRSGMVIGGAKVVDIRDDRVIFQNTEAPAGPPTEVLLEPRLK